MQLSHIYMKKRQYFFAFSLVHIKLHEDQKSPKIFGLLIKFLAEFLVLSQQVV